ncbi:MAG: hypothetical protein LBK73_05865 [Treponema sp.]|nr:hypothetical protein [Treponema sp.]
MSGTQINKSQPIGKEQTRTLPVSNGAHRIWGMVDRMESDRMPFAAADNTAHQ